MNGFEQTAKYLLGVTRPVCFDNQSKQWQYSTHGSAVIIEASGKLFAITAKHVVSGYQHDQILFSYVPGSEFFVPLEHVFEVKTHLDDDTDHKDIRVFSLWEEHLDRSKLPNTAYFPLSANAAQPRTERARYFMVGYPHDLNSTDYESDKLIHQGLIISLDLERENRFVGVDQYRFRNTGELASFQGFSGGGVFSITPTAPGQDNLRFEGLLVKATVESMLGYAIRADFITDYLNGIAKQTEA